MIDTHHSEIRFKVRHLMISTVTGYFKQFALEVITDDDDFTNARTIVFTADTASVDTNNEQRDAHLRSADFFNSEKFGQIKFVGSAYEGSVREGKLTGDLTIRGITKAISVAVEFGGIVVDPYGQTKAGFAVTGKISRREFGLTWDAVTEAGNVVVADEVSFLCEVQLIKQVEVLAG